MSGPWEKYQSAEPDGGSGPWDKYKPSKPSASAGMSPADKVAKGVEDAGAWVLEGPVGKGIAWVGDKLERYVDAPVRAQIGSLQKGDSFVESLDAGARQLGKDTLPSTPSGKEIMSKTGIPTTSMSEVVPGLFSESGEGLALKKGGIADVSPAGVYGGIIQPSVFAVPSSALVTVAGKGRAAASKLGATLVESGTPLVRMANEASGLARNGVFRVGEVMTGGALKADKAIASADRLTGTQLLIPDAYLKGAGRQVGAARDAIAAGEKAGITESLSAAKSAGEANGIYSGLSVADVEKMVPKGLSVPGGQEAVYRIRNIIKQGEKEAFRHPGSTQVLEKIDDLLASGDDISLSQVDGLIQDLNNVEYTVAGNQRQIEPRWKKPVAEARAELDDLLNKLPEGQNLQGAKDDFSALKTAQGQRSKLMGGLSMVGSVGGAATALALSNPVVAATVALASRAIAPRTYFQIVGLAKLPKDAAKTLFSAYSSASETAFAKTMSNLAEKYPQEMARVSTAVTNYTQESPVPSKINKAIERRAKRAGE